MQKSKRARSRVGLHIQTPVRVHVCMRHARAGVHAYVLQLFFYFLSCIKLPVAPISQQSKYRQLARVGVNLREFVRAESGSQATSRRINELYNDRYRDNSCDPTAKTRDVGRWPWSGGIQLPLPRRPERRLC